MSYIAGDLVELTADRTTLVLLKQPNAPAQMNWTCLVVESHRPEMPKGMTLDLGEQYLATFSIPSQPIARQLVSSLCNRCWEWVH